jgi:DNA-binding transcriptional regulator YiaG
VSDAPIDIKTLRKERLKWTQEELASYLGVDRATVSRMETGQPPSGPIERLLRQLEQHGPASTEAA